LLRKPNCSKRDGERVTGSAKLTWFLGGALLGAVSGFAYGTEFDLRLDIDWTAVGAVASFLVVVVALIPIFVEYTRKARQATSTRDHALSLLIQIESLLDLRITTPAIGPFNAVDAAPVHELFALIPQLHFVEDDEARNVTVAAGRTRMLVLVNANPAPGHQLREFRDCFGAVTRALCLLRNRTTSSRRAS